MLHHTCSTCDRTLLDVQEEGMLRIRARVILVSPDNGDVFGLCPQCKSFAPLPLRMVINATGNDNYVENDTKCFTNNNNTFKSS